jgi:NTE family protein
MDASKFRSVRPMVPDVLVLGGGGLVGEAWMSGFLAGAQSAWGVDFREAKEFVGTSAGSIVAAHLAKGIEPRVPPGPVRAAPTDATARDIFNAGVQRGFQGWASAVYPITRRATTAGATVGALARAALLAGLPAGTRSMEDLSEKYAAVLGLRFDPRLRIVAVDRHTGRRLVFGGPAGAPDATLVDAISASCALPGYFAPVEIAGHQYVDGGVWSATNIDVATVRHGDRMLCLTPTAVLSMSRWPAVRAVGRAWQLATTLEAAAARRAGATVTVIAPDARSVRALGENLMDTQCLEDALAEGFRQGSGGLSRTGQPSPGRRGGVLRRRRHGGDRPVPPGRGRGFATPAITFGLVSEQ